MTSDGHDRLAVTRQRQALNKAGFHPLPLRRKRPAFDEWQLKKQTNDAEIALWAEKSFPDALNTGILTFDCPAIDIDIDDENAAEAIEQLLRDEFAEHGKFLVRIGKPPHRAIPFRTDKPFKKLVLNLTVADGRPAQKIEILCDGQQLVSHGIHPDTNAPWHWFGGEPGEVKRSDLPELNEADAQALLKRFAELLAKEHGLTASEPTHRQNGNGHGDYHDPFGAPRLDRVATMRAILAGENLHDNTRDLQASDVALGWSETATQRHLEELMLLSRAPHDKRFHDRLTDLRRSAHGAMLKYARAHRPYSEPTPQLRTPAEVRKGLPFHLPTDITMAPRPWLIKHVIARGDTSTWIGAPGATKSALLVDIAVHLVGQPAWRGKVVKDRCAVVYFALERVGLVDRRLHAYRQRGDLDATAPLAVVGRIIDLLNVQCVQLVLDTIKAVEDRCGLGVGLVVFDTYSKAIAAGGGDENAAKDQNRVCANLRRIIELAPVHIAGVGHTGKNPTLGERGSNAKLADVDVEVTITGELGVRTATVTKANDQDEGLLTSYELERRELGTDPDGDAICTYILDRDANSVVAPVISRHRLSDRQKNALECLADVVLSRGKQPPVGILLRSSDSVVEIDLWMSELVSRNIIPAAAKNPWARFSEISNALMARGRIGVRDKFVWLVRG